MNHNLKGHESVLVVSIHDRDERGVLDFDVLQILEAIIDLVATYSWAALNVDCIGARMPEGTFLSTADLLDIARHISQTVDGALIGIPQNDFPRPTFEEVVQIAAFPSSCAIIAIVAVDSTYFEVFTKVPSVVDRLKKTFRDVHDEDAAVYFT